MVGFLCGAGAAYAKFRYKPCCSGFCCLVIFVPPEDFLDPTRGKERYERVLWQNLAPPSSISKYSAPSLFWKSAPGSATLRVSLQVGRCAARLENLSSRECSRVWVWQVARRRAWHEVEL